MTTKQAISHLYKSGFLKRITSRRTQRTRYVLRTPFILKLAKEVTEKLEKKYNPNLEKGGVLLAFPSIESGTRILEIRKVLFLRNLSNKPENSFSFRLKSVRNTWIKALKNKQLCIPIHFHTHPCVDDFSKSTALHFSPMSTSKADQITSLGLILPTKSAKFHIPTALVVMSKLLGKRLLIGFYGGGITPPDFSEYLAVVTGKTIKEIFDFVINWIKKDPKRKFMLVLLLVCTGFLVVKYPKQVLPFIAIFLLYALLSMGLFKQSADEYPKYFALLKQNTKIIIPKYSKQRRKNIKS